MRSSRSVLLGIVTAVLGGLIVIPNVAGAASNKDVIVANGPNQAVPVAPQGITQVSGNVSVNGSSVKVSEGTVAVSGGTINVGNGPNSAIPVDVQNSTVAAEPFQRLVPVSISESSFGSATFDIPADRAITFERVGVPDLFGADVESITVTEACDFSDGQSGLGGYIAVPIGPKAEGADNAIDHLTQLHLDPGTCSQIFVNLVDPLSSGSSLSFSVVLSGTQTEVPAQPAEPNAKARTKQDPAYQNLLKSIKS